MDQARIDAIRARCARWNKADNGSLARRFSSKTLIREDVPYLLDRVEALEAERDAWRERAEAAERDMLHAISMSPYAICGLFCKNHKPGCGRKNCRPEWRGSDAREGV